MSSSTDLTISDTSSTSGSESSDSSSSSGVDKGTGGENAELSKYTYDDFPFDGTYCPGLVDLSPVLKKDPDLFQLVHILQTDESLQELLKSANLRPKRVDLPAAPQMGQPVKGDYFGTCQELKFNDKKPDCKGRVTSKSRPSKKNPKDLLYYYHCGTCRKEISMNNQLFGFKASRTDLTKPMTFMAFCDKLGRPNTKVTPREIIFLLYAVARNWKYEDMKFYSYSEFSFGQATLVDWAHYVRRVININRRYRPKIGGPGVVVQIDESLFRGRRKNMTGRLLLGDRGRDARRRNYGNRVDGPWIVGMIDSNKNVRLFFVRDRSANTLLHLIRSVVLPGSIIHTDGWGGYYRVGQGEWPDGEAAYGHQIVNHSVEFVSAEGAHTQAIERVWTDIKTNFIKIKRSTSKELFHEHIAYYEWLLNTPVDKRFHSLCYLVGAVANAQ